jgi:hypothetical protein
MRVIILITIRSKCVVGGRVQTTSGGESSNSSIVKVMIVPI